MSFARFCKYFFFAVLLLFCKIGKVLQHEFCKVLQFSILQEFANRFFVWQVLQGFCKG